MKADLHFDYTTVGHVTIDVLPDGSRRAGGSAFYSALQAARLGAHALILTQGVAEEIEALIEPYRSELHVQITPAQHTTTLRTQGTGASRTQRVLAWAGPMSVPPALHSNILHLAPVLRECPAELSASHRFLALTPQGLLRTWSDHGDVSLAAPEREWTEIASRCHALVLSEQERPAGAALVDAAQEGGGIVALTAGGDPTTVLLDGGRAVLQLEVPAVKDAGHDLGAGDVFAAAFFIELARGSSPPAAAAFANGAAAVRMRSPGPDAIGDRTAIAERLRTLPP